MTVAAMDMNPDLAPAIRADIAMIRRNVELEAKLIDDLLDLSRVAAGKLRLDLEAVDVNEAVRYGCHTCRPFILEKGINLHCDLPRDPFEQGDANITRQFGGMGLGLAISKALVELHGGTIRAESGPNETIAQAPIQSS